MFIRKKYSLLKPHQALYLVLSIIIWLLIALYHILKFGLLIFFCFRRKFHVLSVKYYAYFINLFWLIIYDITFLFMFIGFIYDIAMIINGKIETIVYPIIYFVVCFVYVIISFFDYILKDKTLYLILRKMKEVPIFKSEEKEDEIKNSDQRLMKKKEESVKKESVKAKEE